jgi:hypothetical protein
MKTVCQAETEVLQSIQMEQDDHSDRVGNPNTITECQHFKYTILIILKVVDQQVMKIKCNMVFHIMWAFTKMREGCVADRKVCGFASS